MDDKELDNLDNEKEATLYEIAYILAPQIPEEHLAEMATRVTGLVEKHAGSIVLADNPKLRALAYTIEKSHGGKKSKYNQGYFGWVKCMLVSTVVPEIDKELKLIPEVVRYMIIHTVKQAPAYVPRKRPTLASVAGGPVVSEGEKPTEAELDKEVENLIASTIPAAV